MKPQIALCAAFLLTACASTQEPRIQIREVKVPISVKCAADPGPNPTYSDSKEAIRAAPNIFVKTQLVLAGRAERMARLIVLEAANSGCH